jgi:hypothetical protein
VVLALKSLLTKDNLVKRNWQGSKNCCYCDQDESIQHLFISCPLAKVVWSIFHMAFNITLQINITNLFGLWLARVSQKKSELVSAFYFGPYGISGIIIYLTR